MVGLHIESIVSFAHNMYSKLGGGAPYSKQFVAIICVLSSWMTHYVRLLDGDPWPPGEEEIWGSNPQAKHAIANCCCHLANRNEKQFRLYPKPAAYLLNRLTSDDILTSMSGTWLNDLSNASSSTAPDVPTTTPKPHTHDSPHTCHALIYLFNAYWFTRAYHVWLSDCGVWFLIYQAASHDATVHWHPTATPI